MSVAFFLVLHFEALLFRAATDRELRSADARVFADRVG
jgi:hypothetical protein